MTSWQQRGVMTFDLAAKENQPRRVAASVPSQDLVRPIRGHLCNSPLANVSGYFQTKLNRRDIVEEIAQIGEGGAKLFDALFSADLELTAALAPLMFRRNTRKEWQGFFHTLPNP